MFDKLKGKTTGQVVDVAFDSGTLVDVYRPRDTFDIKRAQFDQTFRPDEVINPRLGRFYPKGLLRDVAGIFRQNIQPFRCVGIENGRLKLFTQMHGTRLDESEDAYTRVRYVNKAQEEFIQENWQAILDRAAELCLADIGE